MDLKMKSNFKTRIISLKTYSKLKLFHFAWGSQAKGKHGLGL